MKTKNNMTNHPIPLTDDGKYIAVPVPEDSDPHSLAYFRNRISLMHCGSGVRNFINLPPGQYRILSTHDKMTEGMLNQFKQAQDRTSSVWMILERI